MPTLLVARPLSLTTMRCVTPAEDRTGSACVSSLHSERRRGLTIPSGARRRLRRAAAAFAHIHGRAPRYHPPSGFARPGASSTHLKHPELPITSRGKLFLADNSTSKYKCRGMGQVYSWQIHGGVTAWMYMWLCTGVHLVSTQSRLASIPKAHSCYDACSSKAESRIPVSNSKRHPERAMADILQDRLKAYDRV